MRSAILLVKVRRIIVDILRTHPKAVTPKNYSCRTIGYSIAAILCSIQWLQWIARAVSVVMTKHRPRLQRRISVEWSFPTFLYTFESFVYTLHRLLPVLLQVNVTRLSLFRGWLPIGYILEIQHVHIMGGQFFPPHVAFIYGNRIVNLFHVVYISSGEAMWNRATIQVVMGSEAQVLADHPFFFWLIPILLQQCRPTNSSTIFNQPVLLYDNDYGDVFMHCFSSHFCDNYTDHSVFYKL